MPFPSDTGPWDKYEIVDNKFREKGSQGEIEKQELEQEEQE